MKVELLELGCMTAPAGLWRVGEPEPERPARVPVPAHLIEADRERILLDTRLHPGGAAEPAAHYGEASSVARLFGLEQQRTLAERVELATVPMVVLSHLHVDHAGGLALVPESVPIVVQRAEAGRQRSAIERNFFQRRDDDLAARRLRLVEGDHDQVEGDHDQLGDGSNTAAGTGRRAARSHAVTPGPAPRLGV